MAGLSSFATATKRRLQGLSLLVVIALLLALMVAFYNKAFTATVPVTLYVQRAGLQLDMPADVMVRGIIVGQVRSEQVQADHAKLNIDLYSSQAHLVPANATAEILPETLFGEKYVDLVIPARPSPPIRAHAVIALNRSSTAIETEQLFNNLLPLLKALKPEQLSLTLTALADALSGRGNALGANLVSVDQYFRDFNPHLGVFEQDIGELANVAADYSAATPNLLAMARNFSFNARTLVQKQDTLASFLKGTSGFARTMTSVLQQNESALISLANLSEPTLSVLAQYSPEFTCLVDGMVNLSPLLHAAFQALPGSRPELHITLTVVQNQGKQYTYPADSPKYDLNQGPNCDGLPNAPPAPGYAPPNPNQILTSSAAIGLTGSPSEVAAVQALTAPLLGESSSQVPGYTDLLAGPVLRGEAVSF